MTYDDSGFSEPQDSGQSLVIQNMPSVMTAQKVGVKRDLARIMSDIKTISAQYGEKFYYRWSVKDREGKVSYVEGPTIQCAETVARLYGNCTVGARATDEGLYFSIEAFFVDLETGFNLMRPYRQRKSQKTFKTDADRQQDILFQIACSKATRNVITNALRHLCDFAKEEAKNSLVEKIGKNLPGSRQRIRDRLQDIQVDHKRVERIVGRTIDQMLATDIARVVAEIQAIEEGMTNADELWPTEGQQAAELAAPTTGLDQFNAPPAATEQAPADAKPRSTRKTKEAAPPPPPPPPEPAAPVFSLTSHDGTIYDYESDVDFPEAVKDLLEEAKAQGGIPAIDEFIRVNKEVFASRPPSVTVPLTKYADDLKAGVTQKPAAAESPPPADDQKEFF